MEYMGIILDTSRLTWKNHVTKFCKKLGKSLGMIYKNRKVVIETYCVHSISAFLIRMHLAG